MWYILLEIRRNDRLLRRTLNLSEIELTSKKRIGYIDVCKGIAIILVIVGHTIQSDTYLHRLIYSFHIPVFFFISGMFLNLCKYQIGDIRFTIFARKNLVLIFTYVFYSCLFLLFDFVRIIFIGYPIKKIILNFWLFFTTSGINVLWFISTLFWGMYITLRVLIKVKDLYLRFTIILTFSAITAFIGKYLQNDWFQSGNLAKCLYYLILGIARPFSVTIFLFVGYELKRFFTLENNLPLKWLWLFPSAGITCMCATRLCEVDIHLMRFGVFPIYLLGGISGSIFLLILSEYVAKIHVLKKLLSYYGINTIFIMATHNYLPVIMLSEWICTSIMPSQFVLFGTILFVVMIETILLNTVGINVQTRLEKCAKSINHSKCSKSF
ncbi:acyltransferase family protein [Clostridium sp. WB02_MRS01]|nr:acyltransferase family protein [Clostridium sp. WB02_MRS01]